MRLDSFRDCFRADFDDIRFEKGVKMTSALSLCTVENGRLIKFILSAANNAPIAAEKYAN